MFIDANIFIDFLKGKKEAVSFFEKYRGELTTSVVVLMEIIVGFKKKSEIGKFEKLLESLNVDIHQIDEAISEEAYSMFIENYHGTNIGIYDSIIAATALFYGEKFVTLNIKHFRGIRDLKVAKPY